MFNISWNDQSLDKIKDELLSQKVKGGDNQAFEVLYDRRKDKIYSYIWNILNYNDDDASNVLSDVFIKIFEYIKVYEVNNFKTLLYRIAHNTAIDWIRTNKSGIHIDEESVKWIQDEKDIIEKDNINTKFKQEIMMFYMSRMEDKFRDVLYLYYHEEKSYDEIAEIMGSNKNSVGTMISNAKKILKEKIKDEKVLEGLLN